MSGTLRPPPPMPEAPASRPAQKSTDVPRTSRTCGPWSSDLCRQTKQSLLALHFWSLSLSITVSLTQPRSAPHEVSVGPAHLWSSSTSVRLLPGVTQPAAVASSETRTTRLAASMGDGTAPAGAPTQALSQAARACVSWGRLFK